MLAVAQWFGTRSLKENKNTMGRKKITKSRNKIAGSHALTSGAYPSPTPTQVSGGMFGSGRKWEELNFDEKVEKLMRIVSALWIENRNLTMINSELQRHEHDVNGNVFIRQSIGSRSRLDDLVQDIVQNPFNADLDKPVTY